MSVPAARQAGADPRSNGKLLRRTMDGGPRQRMTSVDRGDKGMARKMGRIRSLQAFLVLMLLCGAAVGRRSLDAAQTAARIDEAAREKILSYIRARFGMPDTVKLTFGDPHPSSAAPGFSEAAITVAEGSNSHPQTVLVSNDLRYLVVVTGTVLDVQQKTPAAMAQRLRDAFKIPANQNVSVGGFRPSASPAFEQGTLTVSSGSAPPQEAPILLERGGAHLMVGEIYNLGVDPRKQALRTISLRDEPSQGPEGAPVTIVEYADLECPMCARVHDFLETRVVPRYGNKVRVVFKEFPLPMHDWAKAAAIANECAYEINPAAFVPFRTMIFRSQQAINVANLRDTLLSLGDQAGVDRVKLAGCYDAESSLPHIQRDMQEGKNLDIERTPSLFINGRLIVGLPSEDAYYQVIDGILAGTK